MRTALAVSLVVTVALAGLLAGCGGGDAAESAKQAHLYQAAPGDVPTIRMGWEDSDNPDPSDVVAWLVYRANYAWFGAEAANLIDARSSQSLTEWEDDPDGSGVADFSRTFTYQDYDSVATGTVTATYTHPGLNEGDVYYYRARRVFKPNRGTIPIGSSVQASPAAATALEIDPDDALSEASSPQGPVHYFDAPTLSSPSAGSSVVDPTNVTFSWTNPEGADQFQVRVYRNAELTGSPVIMSGSLTFSDTSGQYTHTASGSNGALAGSTTYYWVVGARRSGEAYPTCGELEGWVLSSVRQFTTTPVPPNWP